MYSTGMFFYESGISTRNVIINTFLVDRSDALKL